MNNLNNVMCFDNNNEKFCDVNELNNDYVVLRLYDSDVGYNFDFVEFDDDKLNEFYDYNNVEEIKFEEFELKLKEFCDDVKESWFENDVEFDDEEKRNYDLMLYYFKRYCNKNNVFKIVKSDDNEYEVCMSIIFNKKSMCLNELVYVYECN